MPQSESVYALNASIRIPWLSSQRVGRIYELSFKLETLEEVYYQNLSPNH